VRCALVVASFVGLLAAPSVVDYLTAERLTVRVALMGEVPDGGFLVTMSACIEVDGIVVDD
jgi:hypothetical protein